MAKTSRGVYQAEGAPVVSPHGPPSTAPIPTICQRIRSGYHGVWHALTMRVRWSRGIVREQPAECLDGLSEFQRVRVSELTKRYHELFELRLGAATALKCYDYLDLLDQTFADAGLAVPTGGRVHDVGSANFWYAAALQALFRPDCLRGIEVDGYRLYPNGHSRWDAAQGYVQPFAGADYLVADYADMREEARTITAWFPFVTPGPVVAWRLPLTVLAPHRLFASVAANLDKDGLFVMVNHGAEEAAIAATYASAAGLSALHTCLAVPVLRSRPMAPVVSLWRRIR